MSSVRKSGAVLFAKNPLALARFYEATAGMKTTHSAPDIIVLESKTFQLMVHPIPPRIARTIKITTPPVRRVNSAVKLVFAVGSIAAARERATALGGALNPPTGMFEARGFRACDGHDPEGNVIQFREALASVAQPPIARGRRAIDYATVRELALSLPKTVDASTMRGIAFKSGGRLIACKAVHRSAEADTLMVRLSATDRARLIAADPKAFYLTPHYEPHDAVLVRLRVVSRTALRQLFTQSWRFVTGARSRR